MHNAEMDRADEILKEICDENGYDFETVKALADEFEKEEYKIPSREMMLGNIAMYASIYRNAETEEKKAEWAYALAFIVKKYAPML